MIAALALCAMCVQEPIPRWQLYSTLAAANVLDEATTRLVEDRGGWEANPAPWMRGRGMRAASRVVAVAAQAELIRHVSRRRPGVARWLWGGTVGVSLGLAGRNTVIYMQVRW